MMQADPRNLGYCPHVVFVYELAARPGTVQFGYRKLNKTGSEASEGAIGAINKMLDEMLREVAR